MVAASIPDALIVRRDALLEILAIARLLFSFLAISVLAGFVEVSRCHSIGP